MGQLWTHRPGDAVDLTASSFPQKSCKVMGTVEASWVTEPSFLEALFFHIVGFFSPAS